MNLRLTPYPEYKDSGLPWLGGIPRHWHTGPGFAAFREKQVKNTGMKEKTVLSLSYGRIVVKPTEKLHGLVPLSFDTYQIVNPGDIIIRSTDLQNDWNSLRVGLVRDRGIITSAYLCFGTTGALTPEYGYLQLHAFDLMKVFYGMGSGLRQNLDFSDFKRMLIFVPPPDEQAAIVRFLDHADRRIRCCIGAKRRLIELLNEQKQAIIHQAVTRGLDPRVRLKPSGIDWLGKVPGHWAVIPLKHAFQLMDYGISDSTTVSGKIRVLTMGNIQNGQVEIPDGGGVDAVDTRLLLREGDLLFNRTNSAELVGKVGLFRGASCGVTFASYLVRLRARDAMDPAFFNYLLNSAAVLRIARQVAVPSLHQSNLNPTRYGRIQVALPPPEEQTQISRFLKAESERHDLCIDHIQRGIEQVREYRTRLIADVVTGKLDVRGVELPPLEDTEEVPLVGDETADGATEEEGELQLVEENTDAAE